MGREVSGRDDIPNGSDPGRDTSRNGVRQYAVNMGWAWALLGAIALNVAACGALVHVAREHTRIWEALNGERQERARQMAKLGSGLAHEIRNPLHALRINLHVLRRAFGGHSSLPEDQLVATISESNSAIDRLDQIMRELLQLSDSSTEGAAVVNLVQELQSALGLLAEDLKGDQIVLRCSLPADIVSISIDPIRLRQSLLNLFAFAKQRAGKGGSIEIGVERRENGVEIDIRDSGPALPADQSEHIFEPFQAPVRSGTGLGLALVQINVENARGRIQWDGATAKGGSCRVWFPLASH